MASPLAPGHRRPGVPDAQSGPDRSGRRRADRPQPAPRRQGAEGRSRSRCGSSLMTRSRALPPRSTPATAPSCSSLPTRLASRRAHRAPPPRRPPSAHDHRRRAGPVLRRSPRPSRRRRAQPVVGRSPSPVRRRRARRAPPSLRRTEPRRLVFPAPEGGYLHLENFRKRVWLPAIKPGRRRPLRVHDLRHTCASLAIAAGADVKVLQRMLGHALGGADARPLWPPPARTSTRAWRTASTRWLGPRPRRRRTVCRSRSRLRGILAGSTVSAALS